MRKDRKSINIMMILIVLVSIIGIGVNIFLVHNDKETSGNVMVQLNQTEQSQEQASGEQKDNSAHGFTSIADITESTLEGQVQTDQKTTEYTETASDITEQDTQSQTAEESSATVYYIDGASSVNLRSADYNKSKILGWLAKGTEVEMIEKGKYYSYIKCGDMQGYVYNEYISQR